MIATHLQYFWRRSLAGILRGAKRQDAEKALLIRKAFSSFRESILYNAMASDDLYDFDLPVFRQPRDDRIDDVVFIPLRKHRHN